MSTIVLRSVKGSPLTNAEVDANFSNLNTDKVEKTAAAITGGTINNTSVGATTPSTGAFTTLSSTGNTTLGDATADTVTINGTVQPGVVISGSSTGDALRITQTGTGNALVVEDSANPDATPFVVDANGRVGIGSAPLYSVDGLSIYAATSFSPQSFSRSAASDGSASYFNFEKVRGSSIVQSGDDLGTIAFRGFDGTQQLNAAWIMAEVDGTPGTNDMPGRLVFATTADGAVSPTERMRLDSSGNLGIGTGAPAARFAVSTGDTRKQFVVNTSTDPVVQIGLPDWYNIGSLAFINGSGGERMRIDSSGNVGIGTSSPGAKLQIEQNQAAYTYVDLVNTTAGGGAIFRQIVRNIANSGTTSVDFAKLIGSGLAINNNDTNAANFTSFGVGASERMRLDSSGNVGIGTSSPANKLDVAGNGLFTNATYGFVGVNSGTVQTQFAANAGAGLDIRVVSNHVMNFFTNNVERMRINSAGNVGIGTSSPDQRLRVVGTSGTAQFGAGTAGNAVFINAFDSDTIYMTAAASNANAFGFGSASNIPTFFMTNNSERMRISPTGDVGIGTSSPDAGLTVIKSATISSQVNVAARIGSGVTSDLLLGSVNGNTPFVASQGANPLSFFTNATERARIDSSGNLLVGTTSASSGNTSGRVRIVDNTGGINTLYCEQTVAGGYSLISNTVSNGGTYYHANFLAAATSVGAITSSATTTTYATSSDYRLKNTIAPMTGALAKVALLKPCTYKWNANGSDGEGFIAHELAEVVPQCVTGQKDAVDAEGKPQYQGIDTSFLVATLTAAIQELKAEFDAYKASHP